MYIYGVYIYIVEQIKRKPSREKRKGRFSEVPRHEREEKTRHGRELGCMLCHAAMLL